MPDENASVSPDQQRAAIRALVEARGFACEWYVDAEGHRSGLSEEGRPAWLQLKAQLPRADVAGIAAYDLSRIHRNTREFLEFVDELEKLHKRMVLVHDMVDTGTAGGRMLATVLVSMYEMEARKTSERVTANIEYKRRALGWHWGTIPFGCIRIKGCLQPDPDTLWLTDAAGALRERPYHAALQQAYEWFAGGDYTYDSLTAALNAAGWRFKNRQGVAREWTRDDVRRILAAWRLYAGDLPLGRQKDHPAEVIAGLHDPILEPDLCRRVGAELERHARAYTTHGPRSSYLLTPLLVCHNCDQPLTTARQEGVRYYRHAARCKIPAWIPADGYERSFTAWVGALDTPGLPAALHAALAAISPTGAAAHRELLRLEAQQPRLLQRHLAGDLPLAAYLAASDTLAAQLRAAQAALPPGWDDIQPQLTRFRALSQDLGALDYQEQKDVIHSLFARIEISGNPLDTGHLVRLTPRDWLASLWPFIWRAAPDFCRFRDP
jgi:DNA invertase Pin-like site-specific DNA recombinase